MALLECQSRFFPGPRWSSGRSLAVATHCSSIAGSIDLAMSLAIALWALRNSATPYRTLTGARFSFHSLLSRLRPYEWELRWPRPPFSSPPTWSSSFPLFSLLVLALSKLRWARHSILLPTPLNLPFPFIHSWWWPWWSSAEHADPSSPPSLNLPLLLSSLSVDFDGMEVTEVRWFWVFVWYWVVCCVKFRFVVLDLFG